jgi:4-hydroxybenzoate polyprenyltransferase
MEKNLNNCIPLFVDLDGTFIKTDLLFESFIVLIKQNPFNIFRCILWLFKGNAYLKHQIALQVDLAVTIMPLNTEFHSFLQTQKHRYSSIILATASTEKYARSFVEEYDLFDSYISSDENTNLKGREKLDKITGLTKHYAYAGNGIEDFTIFKNSDESYLVNPSNKVKRRSLNLTINRVFDDNGIGFRNQLEIWLKQIRVIQWLKNLPIFVTLLLTGNYKTPDLVLLTLLGFLCFSLLASSTYILNDLFDLEADRKHPRKKTRPLAGGSISIYSAIFSVVFLFLISFALSYIFIPGSFLYILLGYFVITLLYSFKIKQVVGLDVITLASLYTIRIIAGSAILNITTTFWLLSFSMFVFFSLALVKRCAELKVLESQNKSKTSGRGYSLKDYGTLMSLGTSSSLMSLIMFVFYTQSDVSVIQYQDPTLLWLIIPLLGYWFVRVWIKTNRGEMHDDPIVFAIKDKGSLVAIGMMVVITLLAQLY